MTLKTDWTAVRKRIENALHPTKLHTARRFAQPEDDDREWVILYRTAAGFCCLYKSLPVEFEDMLDAQMWAEEMDVRPYFMGL
ncbi:hypothetical protein [Paraburkholderia ferrariae]|jgi:hypothetical protein|uniref:hypothetical protein n=1 Tax=Paraburkholderia ferrariae TaxID=386056 RepID=UPI000480B4C0|nr:hypothetical protein [Paraburkholderia ferrariae]